MYDCEQVLHLQPEEESPVEAQTSSELRDPECLRYDGIQRGFFRNSDTPETYIFQRYVFAQASHFILMALRSANQDFLWGKKKRKITVQYHLSPCILDPAEDVKAYKKHELEGSTPLLPVVGSPDVLIKHLLMS